MLASLSQTNFVKDCWRYRFTPNASTAVGTTLQSHTISWNEKAFLLIFFRLHGYYSYICNLFLKSR